MTTFRAFFLIVLTVSVMSCDGSGNINLLPYIETVAPEVDEQTEITITGLDADGSVETIEWVQTDKDDPVITQVTESNSFIKFTTPAVTIVTPLEFEFTVTDDKGLSETYGVTLTVNPVNTPPEAITETVVEVLEQTDVTLDGSGSTDSDGNIESYVWVQTDTTGLTIDLSAADTTEPAFTFMSPVVVANQDLTFSLSVTDNEGATSTNAANVKVTILPVNAAPVAHAGDNITVSEQTPLVSLDGSLSNDDTDGNIQSYQWEQTGGDQVVLSDVNVAKPTFTSPVTLTTSQVLSFSLTVTDNEDATATDLVEVTILPVNADPVAHAGADFEVDEQTPLVSLDGSLSNDDTDGNIQSYQWEQTGGDQVVLSDVNVAKPTFTSPVTLTNSQVLSFSLTVTDNEGATATDLVEVTILPVNAVPVAHAGADFDAFEQTSVSLNGSLSNDDTDGNIQSYRWEQIDGVEVVLSDLNVVEPTFTAPETLTVSQVLSFSLTVTDNEEATAVDQVSVTILPNSPPVVTADTLSGGSLAINDEGIQVTLTATDPDSHPVTYELITNPNSTLGSISDFNSAEGTFIYTPAGANLGLDQFNVIARDYLDSSDEYTVTITITAALNQQETESAEDYTANDPGTAIRIYQKSPITAAIVAAPDHDVFSYTAFTEGTVLFTLDVPTSSADAYFEAIIYDADGTSIITQQSTGKDVDLYVTAAAGQEFYIQINSATLLDTANYVLTAENYESATATLSWHRPLANVDDTPLIDLDQYRIYYGIGTAVEDRNQIIAIAAPTLETPPTSETPPISESHEISHLRLGEIYSFAMTAINSHGIESELSADVSKQF